MIFIGILTGAVLEIGRRIFPDKPKKARLHISASLVDKVASVFRANQKVKGHKWIWRVAYIRDHPNSDWQFSYYTSWSGSGPIHFEIDPDGWYIGAQVGIEHRGGSVSMIASSTDHKAGEFRSGSSYELTMQIDEMYDDESVRLFWSIIDGGKCSICENASYSDTVW